MTPTDMKYLYLSEDEQQTVRKWVKKARKWFEQSFTEQVADYSGNSVDCQRKALAHYGVARRCFLESVNAVESVVSSRQEVTRQLVLVSSWITLTQADLSEMRVKNPPLPPTLSI